MTLATGARTHALFDSDATLYACDNSDGQLGTERNHRVETLPVNVNIHLTQVSSTAQNVAGQQ